MGALVEATIEVRDRVANRALAERLGKGLEAVGWATLDPVGGRFDPAQHRAVDREVTADPRLHDTVAAVERTGYRDPSGRIVRQPEVVVYRYEAESEGGRP